MSARSAIVLAGGLGTRLRPLTDVRPKQMLPIVDRPMIEHVVGKLAAEGAEDVVLSLGYRPDAFGAAYSAGRCGGANLRYATEPEPLGTAGAVLFAARRASAPNGNDRGDPFSETFWALNGDVLTDAVLSDLLALHRARRAEATILTVPMTDASRYGMVEADAAGRVTRFVEKPPGGDAASGWINAGVYVLEPSVLARIPAGRAVSMERETFPAVATDGALYTLRSNAYWIDAGTPRSYLQANIDLTSGRRALTLAPVSPRAAVAAGVSVIDSVVMEGAVVAAGARLEGAVVLPGGRIGAGAVVSESVVGFGAAVEPGARVRGFTLLGDGATVEAGDVVQGGRLSGSSRAR
ncbi:MAG: NDP-sugar synthase [bacterium]|nr:NDP-sugar synthase [bacterium]